MQLASSVPQAHPIGCEGVLGGVCYRMGVLLATSAEVVDFAVLVFFFVFFFAEVLSLLLAVEGTPAILAPAPAPVPAPASAIFRATLA